MNKKKIKNVREAEQQRQEAALERYTEMMIHKIETIQQDWKKPWFCDTDALMPRNLNGRTYNGMNSLMLMMLCEEKGYEHPIFCTFDRMVGLNYTKDKQGKPVQVTNENGEPLPHVGVNKGEKSFPVFLQIFNVVHKDTKVKVEYEEYIKMSEEQRKEYNVFPNLRVYNVFNIDQTNMAEARPEMYEELIKASEPKTQGETTEDGFIFEPVDKMINKNTWICPIKPTYGNDAYYSISQKVIVVPEKVQFNDGESFYSTIFHEMAHSTGAEDQLNRLQPTSFGSAEYAKEELVAELTAAIVAQNYGMVKHIKDDSAAYLKEWLDSLKQDASYIKTVLLDVKKASQIIINHIG